MNCQTEICEIVPKDFDLVSYENGVYKSSEWNRCKSYDHLCAVKDIMSYIDSACDILVDAEVKLTQEQADGFNELLNEALDRLTDGAESYDEKDNYEDRYNDLHSAVQNALENW